jgi:hypothetical protein
VDLEATEAELERQRQDFAWQQNAHPLSNDDDGHTGDPSSLCFPRTTYNMAAAACHLEDISDTPDLKTNERLNKAKQLLRVALEQQAKSLASWRHATLSRPSPMMATANRGALMLTPRRRWGPVVTPLATALTSRGLGAPSLDKSEGVTLYSVSPYAP